MLNEKWFIWLSAWSFYSVTVYFVCATIVTAIHYKRERKETGNSARHTRKNGVGSVTSGGKKDGGADSSRNSDNRCYVDTNDGEVVFTAASQSPTAIPMAWFHEALWVIYNIAAVAAILVTLAFWILIYSPSSGDDVTFFGITFHVINSLVVIGDTMLSSVPVRLFHVVYPMLYSIAYILFTVIYWGSGGTNPFGMPYIYPQTDYAGRPVFSAVSQLCLVFIGLPLCQSIVFCFFRLRVWMKTKCAK